MTRSSPPRPSGRFVYTVTGTQIVSPDDYLVITTTDPTVATLTLTSCHPVWTTSQRIVVTSELDQTQSDPVGEAVVNYGRPLEPIGDAGRPRTERHGGTRRLDGDHGRSGTGHQRPVVSEPVTRPTTDATTDAPTDGTDADSTIDAGIADAFAEGWFSDPTANAQVALWGIVLALIGARLVPDQPQGQA